MGRREDPGSPLQHRDTAGTNSGCPSELAQLARAGADGGGLARVLEQKGGRASKSPRAHHTTALTCVLHERLRVLLQLRAPFIHDLLNIAALDGNGRVGLCGRSSCSGDCGVVHARTHSDVGGGTGCAG